jgi:hypothetical protein
LSDELLASPPRRVGQLQPPAHQPVVGNQLALQSGAAAALHESAARRGDRQPLRLRQRRPLRGSTNDPDDVAPERDSGRHATFTGHKAENVAKIAGFAIHATFCWLYEQNVERRGNAPDFRRFGVFAARRRRNSDRSLTGV